MEESWGEMQHKVSYPHPSSRHLTYQLTLLKHAADLSDDIARDVWKRKDSPPMKSSQLVELAKSAKQVVVATKTLQWTADQIKDKGDEWAPNWTEAHGNFIYYVPKCPDPKVAMFCGKSECETCPKVEGNARDVLQKVSTLKMQHKVCVEPIETSLLENLISDRVYLEDAVYPGSDAKEYEVYVVADSRMQSDGGDGEADRVIRNEKGTHAINDQDRREHDELKAFFSKLPKPKSRRRRSATGGGATGGGAAGGGATRGGAAGAGTAGP